MGWWKLRRTAIRIRVLDDLGLIIVRVIGPFDGQKLSAQLIDLTDKQPGTAIYRMIFDFRFAAGVIKDTDAERVRDHRYLVRERIGRSDVPDGPHALIGGEHDSLEAIADSHRELNPQTKVGLGSSVDTAWTTTMGEVPMPKDVRAFFSET